MSRPKATNRDSLPSIPLGWQLEDARFKQVETREETKARFARESQAATHRVFRESAAFLMFGITVCLVVLGCLWIILGAAYSLENQEWASTLLTSIVRSGLGYITGKASGKVAA